MNLATDDGRLNPARGVDIVECLFEHGAAKTKNLGKAGNPQGVFLSITNEGDKKNLPYNVYIVHRTYYGQAMRPLFHRLPK